MTGLDAILLLGASTVMMLFGAYFCAGVARETTCLLARADRARSIGIAILGAQRRGGERQRRKGSGTPPRGG
jgi:hypothetical protein